MTDATEEKFMRDCRDLVETVMEDLTTDMAADLQRALSVPVGRDAKGRVVVRSKPGEYPRMETGRLRASVEHVVYHTADVVHGVVATNTPYDQRLIAMRREYDKYMEQKWERLAVQRFAISLR